MPPPVLYVRFNGRASRDADAERTRGEPRTFRSPIPLFIGSYSSTRLCGIIITNNYIEANVTIQKIHHAIMCVYRVHRRA